MPGRVAPEPSVEQQIFDNVAIGGVSPHVLLAAQGVCGRGAGCGLRPRKTDERAEEAP